MADAVFAAVSSNAPISLGARPQPQKWVKTLPLLGNAAELRAAIEIASGVSGQPPRPLLPSTSSNGLSVSPAQETAHGTFQAVTVPRAPLVSSPGTAIAASKSRPSIPNKPLILGVALAVVIVGLGVGIFLIQKSPNTDESAQAAQDPPPSVVANTSNSVFPAVPVAQQMPSSATSTALPLSETAVSARPLPLAKTAAPVGTAPATTAPKPAPSPRKNPLDIND
jgi:hypothetical protein